MHQNYFSTRGECPGHLIYLKFFFKYANYCLTGDVLEALERNLQAWAPGPDGLIAQSVEHCAGIAEVMGSNPVQVWTFSGFNFTTAQVVCVTAMINHKFIYFSAVPIYDLSYIHLHSLPSTGILRTLQRVYYDSSVGRVLHRYRRAHGFESRSGLNFFQALISQLLKSCVKLR